MKLRDRLNKSEFSAAIVCRDQGPKGRIKDTLPVNLAVDITRVGAISDQNVGMITVVHMNPVVNLAAVF